MQGIGYTTTCFKTRLDVLECGATMYKNVGVNNILPQPLCN